jgi:TonB family protein
LEAVVSTAITFHIYEGDQHVRSATFSQDVIKIGKLDSSHLRVDDEAVSRMHSVIEVSGPGEVYIIDLGSASGTILNGQKVNKARLESGDQLQFGNTTVVVELGEAAAEEEEPMQAAPVAAPQYQQPQQPQYQPPPQQPQFQQPQYQQPAQVPNPFGQGASTAGFGGQPQSPFAQPQYAAPAQPQYSQPMAVTATGLAGEALRDYGEAVTYALAPTAPPVNPADIDSAENAVEVVVMWGELSILHVEHLSPPRGFYIGESTDAKGKPNTDFLIGSESIGTERMPVTVDSGATCAVVVPNGASGDVTINNQSITFQELAAQGQMQAASELAGAMQYPLPAGATARVHFRGFTFIVRPTSAARRVAAQSPVDKVLYGWMAASGGFFAGLLLLFYFLPPWSSSLSLDLLNADSRLVKYLIEPPETQEEETPEWLDESKMDEEEGGKGKRHKDEEGQMGKKDEQKTKNKFGIEGPQDNEDPHMAREEAKEMAANAGIIGILKASVGAWNSPTSPYGRDSALGADPMSALGALMGDQIGSNFGFGGLGLRGTGRGGGGTGEGTIGLGNIGTIGHGAGGGEGSGYGRGAGGFHGRDAKVPRIRSGKADVRGSLSKEVIRRIINRHINEVRFCYEQELNQRPDLQGRVAIQFIVSPTGAVQTAAVNSSDLGNQKVEQCIVSAVRRWSFPSPEGGGIVVVTYPFVLQQTGG